jgi:histidine ammonia-lyase
LVLVEENEILSTGNFHTTALALALDTVALALAQTAALSASRAQRMLSERLTGLPANLTPRGPSASGFAPLTKTAQALATEIRLLANPASIDPRAGAEGVEDDASNAPLAVRKLADIIGCMTHILAIELIEAAQAVDLRKPARLGQGAALAYETVRNLVPPLDRDRPLGVEVERVAKALSDGALVAALRRSGAAGRALQA